VVDVLDDNTARPYLRAIGQHYADAQNFAEAERLFVKGGFYREAIDMYIAASKWEDAHVLACKYMAPADVADMYVTQAEAYQGKRMYKDAEKLYVEIFVASTKCRLHDSVLLLHVRSRFACSHVACLLQQSTDCCDKVYYCHAESL
jgi:hypothetical protein